MQASASNKRGKQLLTQKTASFHLPNGMLDLDETEQEEEDAPPRLSMADNVAKNMKRA